uniref:Uncharacterized protein n=1 Tax=Leptobrachium leishanense TaxID=445787 RepID=A0A8C5MIM3_9ANUR
MVRRRRQQRLGGSRQGAGTQSAGLRDELTCSVCLNVYTNPVTLTCGHSFCRTCVGNTRAQSCPECRAGITGQAELKRNQRTCNLSKPFSSPPPRTKKAGVACTYCDDSAAAKTCLHCEASLCENHLRVHSKSEEHVLVEPTTSLDSRKCAIHKEVLKYYCSEDDLCICASCGLVGAHAGHKVEALNEAAERKKENLRNLLGKLASERDDVEDQIDSIEERKKVVQNDVPGVTDRVAALVMEVQKQLAALHKEVHLEISKQEEQAILRVSDLVQHLEVKKEELYSKIAHIKQLCNVTDPLTVLQGAKSETKGIDTEDVDNSGDKVHSLVPLDVNLILETLCTGLARIVNEVKKRCSVPETSGSLNGIKVTLETAPDVDQASAMDLAVEVASEAVPDVDTVSENLSDTEEAVTNVLPHANGVSDTSLDVNTASNNVDISDDLKIVSWAETRASRPYRPERFYYPQVLSSQGFSSRRLEWEVEGNESGGWLVGMAYPSIDRKGQQSAIGYNEESWGLERVNDHQYLMRHNCKEFKIHHKPSCSRIKIHLDYNAGQLSFYELGDSPKHLHTFSATFTEPLHLALWVFVYDLVGEQRGSWVKILQ